MNPFFFLPCLKAFACVALWASESELVNVCLCSCLVSRVSDVHARRPAAPWHLPWDSLCLETHKLIDHISWGLPATKNTPGHLPDGGNGKLRTSILVSLPCPLETEDSLYPITLLHVYQASLRTAERNLHKSLKGQVGRASWQPIPEGRLTPEDRGAPRPFSSTALCAPLHYLPCPLY